MQTTRFQSIRARFSPSNLRTTLRRASSSSSRKSYTSISSSSSPADAINSVMFRQPSIVDMEEERKSFGSELNLLEPRPIVYWGGVEERLRSSSAASSFRR